MTFPENFDPIYFDDSTWDERVQAWQHHNVSRGFSGGNAELVRKLLTHSETGLRVVINITPAALESMLRAGAYRNLYEAPVIGGRARTVSEARETVDDKLSLGSDTYFGALAVGGSGVRYYGAYCLVLSPELVEPDTQLFDRDSYDILLPPLLGAPMNSENISVLTGKWQTDRIEMVMLKVLPEMRHDSRLVTAGMISSLVLRDQEFVEVHLRQKFGPEDLEEIRESPDDAATEIDILERRRAGLHVASEEGEWVRRRSRLAELMDDQRVKHRVVTMYGRGYQWM
ncbi:hypothetical protein E3T55_11660 [Cryobacterium frigoriphilum]|uniref:Uncharacterized protein n=1 Tax=Cryobacterium frigoriphilum TaxID=1259150 RepID=A0A4R8ZZ20_9MICO|nr:hypothetical protein [Cryobacterium frigoriphilum]TFD49125.1 hypothetical protein E3T55_11660 [Cryobacterium frigoriphilum]